MADSGKAQIGSMHNIVASPLFQDGDEVIISGGDTYEDARGSNKGSGGPPSDDGKEGDNGEAGSDDDNGY